MPDATGLSGLTLLHDINRSDSTPESLPERFVMVQMRQELILLDTLTGDSWRLVFTDDGAQPLRWEPIPRRASNMYRQGQRPQRERAAREKREASRPGPHHPRHRSQRE